MDFESGQNQEFSSVTQCPFCSTAFHIGRPHLDAAGGQVRCGGCLQIFNAKDHFLVEQKNLFDDDSFNSTDNPTTELEEPELETPAQQEPDPFSIDLLGAEIIDNDGPVLLGNVDHNSGDAIPREAILKNKVYKFKQEDYEHASANDVLGMPSQPITPIEPQKADVPELAENLMEVVSGLKIELDPTETATEITTETIAPTIVNPELNPAKNDTPDSEFFIKPSKQQAGKKSSPQGLSKAIWAGILTTTIFAIPLQLLYLQPRVLVEKSWFRDLHATACSHIGCNTPIYTNIEAIKISGFIEPHPDYVNSLVAKIDLRNTAESEQAFPIVAIFFRNVSGRITASRKFEPKDYLKDEALNLKEMPVNRTIQLELELIDPGEQSTSYEMFVQ